MEASSRLLDTTSGPGHPYPSVVTNAADMRHMRTICNRLIAALALLALLAGACGSGDDSSVTDSADGDAGAADSGDDSDAGDSGATTDSADSGESDSSGGDSGPCPEPGFVGSISRGANPDSGHVDASFGTADVWLDGVVAYRLSDGAHYTMYVSDHEYVGDTRDFDTIVAAPGGTVATLSLGVFEGMTVDESFSPGDEGTIAVVIIDSGGGAQSFAGGASGTVTPIGWNDDIVCFDIDFTDDFQTVTGQISALVVAGF